MTQAQVERFFGNQCLIPALQALGQSRQVTARGGLGAHHEAYYEIHLIMDGSVHWWVENEVHYLHPDTIYLTRPGELHGGVKDMIQPCSLTWLQVDAAALPHRGMQLELAALESRLCKGAHQLVPYVTGMLAECRAPRADSARVVAAFLDLFMAQLLRLYQSEQEARPMPEPFARLLGAIEAQLERPYTIQELCDFAHVSRSRIFQLFDQFVGQSPISYIMSQRIKKAQQLLEYSDKKVTDIAFELGFSSSQHFATAFKRHTGVSPREFRHS